jgi:D-beta-D-heptose 7-phosphate kinase / D-beta-D-heptose 1-phosphate adenosyltransferase
MQYHEIGEILKKIRLRKPSILVLGDIMLDHYVDGAVTKISPEAPVPVLNYQKERSVLGGCGNVAHNLINLGANVTVATIIGDDSDGEIVRGMLDQLRVKTDFIFSTKLIKTTKKTRFISLGNQLLRLDQDSNFTNLSYSNPLFESLKGFIVSFDAVIISDYNKGVCSDDLIKNILKISNQNKIPTFVDPKGKEWNKYKSAFCITPNKIEAEQVLRSSLNSKSDFESASKFIKEKYKLDSCLITKGADGMSYYSGEIFLDQKVGKKRVYDVSGAGDTVIACFASSYASGLEIRDCLKISSFASSAVVSYPGTRPFELQMFYENKKNDE